MHGDLANLIAQLRRAEGTGRNSERYVTELRNRRRLRTEGIWEYHLELHKLAKKAYPNNEAMRNGSLRESFIANINDPYLASRLRELQEFEMEQLLDAAITLHGCQTASSKPIHAVTLKDDNDENQEMKRDQVWRRMDNMSRRMDQLAVNQIASYQPVAAQNDVPVQLPLENSIEERYQYNEPRHSSPDSPPANHRNVNNQGRSLQTGSWVFIPSNRNEKVSSRNYNY